MPMYWAGTPFAAACATSLGLVFRAAQTEDWSSVVVLFHAAANPGSTIGFMSAVMVWPAAAAASSAFALASVCCAVVSLSLTAASLSLATASSCWAVAMAAFFGLIVSLRTPTILIAPSIIRTVSSINPPRSVFFLMVADRSRALGGWVGLTSAGSQNRQSGGAGGQVGSGVQPAGGIHPGGTGGQPGGARNTERVFWSALAISWSSGVGRCGSLPSESCTPMTAVSYTHLTLPTNREV